MRNAAGLLGAGPRWGTAKTEAIGPEGPINGATHSRGGPNRGVMPRAQAGGSLVQESPPVTVLNLPPIPLLPLIAALTTVAVGLVLAVLSVVMVRAQLRRTWRKAFTAGIVAGGLAGYTFRPRLPGGVFTR